MGYTHYFYNNGKTDQKKYDLVLKDIRKIIKANSEILANGMGDIGTKPTTTTRIAFNGIDGDSHETFLLPNEVSKLRDFDFCKTAAKPYDKVVVACLAVLHTADIGFSCSSDGSREECAEGVELAETILGRKFKNIGEA